MDTNYTEILLAWPEIETKAAKTIWYQQVIDDYLLFYDKASSNELKATEAEIIALETRLGCLLPISLKEYHLNYGITELSEILFSVRGESLNAIEPLLDAYPGIRDMSLSSETLALIEKLVAFGDYLGNGNLLCFHRETGHVYYFDHDSYPTISHFFDDFEDYLDGLMILMLGELHDDEEKAERLLIERFGTTLVEIWHY